MSGRSKLVRRQRPRRPARLIQPSYHSLREPLCVFSLSQLVSQQLLPSFIQLAPLTRVRLAIQRSKKSWRKFPRRGSKRPFASWLGSRPDTRFPPPPIRKRESEPPVTGSRRNSN